MAIIIYVEGLSDGLGDYFFGLNVVSALKKPLEEVGYSRGIFLVTHENGKRLISDLGGDKEYGVTVLSREEYEDLSQKNNFHLDFYLEGPVMTTRRIGLQPHTPILLLSEYSSKNEVYSEALRFPKKQEAHTIYSGLRIRYQEKGIFISSELVKVCQSKSAQDFRFRNAYWEELNLNIRAGQSIEQYHQTAELSFQYSYDRPENSAQKFLFIHHLFTRHSKKHQDIVAIGKYKEKKRDALRAALKRLEASGFKNIFFIDLDTGTQEVLRNDPEQNAKTYRLFYVEKLTHRQMIALNALSGELCGMRGDQSHGEAISSQKLIVYDCAPHKEDYAKGFIECLHELSGGDDQVKELLKLLQYADLGDTSCHEYLQLQHLLDDENVLEKYKTACARIPQKLNLGEAIASVVCKPFLEKNQYLSMVSRFDFLRAAYPKKGSMMLFTAQQRFAAVNKTEEYIYELSQKISKNEITYKTALLHLSNHVQEQIVSISSDHKNRKLLGGNLSRLVKLYHKMLPDESTEHSHEDQRVKPFGK